MNWIMIATRWLWALGALLSMTISRAEGQTGAWPWKGGTPPLSVAEATGIRLGTDPRERWRPYGITLKPAKWIWLPAQRTLPNSFVLFRREVDLPAAPTRADGWISADSRYKVTINGAKQAVQLFGPAQHGVAKAVADSVAEGVIPVAEADDLFIAVGVFIHWDAADDKKIQDYNYQATKEAIARAVKGEPKAVDVVAQRNTAKHPFAAN